MPDFAVGVCEAIAMRTSIGFKAVAAGLLLALVGPAQAVFHLMKVVEVFPGTPAAPQAQYVVIQMFASGQNLVEGHNIRVYNAAGGMVATYTFPGNVGNGANQARILIGTQQAAAFFGVQPDLVMTPTMLAAGGKVCFADGIDCVAWGNYTGSSAGVGTPFNAAGGIVVGRAAVRRLDIAGSATALDGGDDTNNCANDFVTGLPAPRNNGGALGTIPSATCGNGALEGLEQCDDGNTSNADACSSTCLAQAVPPPTTRPVGDYNGDGKSDVLWRNGSTGANAIWRSAISSTQQPVTGVTNLAWRVVGRGDFDASGQADILWRNSSTGANVIWRAANSRTQQAVATVPSQSWRVAGVADFNADGRADILWRNDASGANVLWRSALSTQAQNLTAVTVLTWKIVGVGDFNADGRADILWRNDVSGGNVLWRSGLSSQSQTLTTVADVGWRVAGTGDFNADGRADILWRHGNTGANALWRSALSSQQQVLTRVADLNWKVVGTGDFNGDGRADILWRNSATGANALWRSGISSQQQPMASVTNLAWAVVP
jgi:cysteine-rich repeat protein